MMYRKILVLFLVAIIYLIGLLGCSSRNSNVDNNLDQQGGANSEQTKASPSAEVVGEEAAASAENVTELGDSPANTLRTFVIIPEESHAYYLADEEFFEDALAKYGIEAGLNHVIGGTQEIAGQIEINPSDMNNLLGENRFLVDMRTFTTDQNLRDNYIREHGPAFNQFPEAIFTATAVSGLPDNYEEGQEITFEMSGDLTVREISVPVTFDVTATLNGDTLIGTAETQQLMSSFGIEPLNFVRTLTVADEFGIRIEFTAREV